MSEVPVGAIQLFDQVTPVLPAGRYRVRSSAEVTGQGGDVLDAGPEHVLPVEVTGPRFELDASDIASCHPPEQGTGDFTDRLPHVALTRRTLPWERRFSDGTPWLALVVIADGEGALVTGQPLRQAVGEAVFAQLAARDPITGDGPPVTTLQVSSPGLLAGIFPSRRDVALLTHVRRVNLADTDLAGYDDDGWFAIVTANRLPVSAGAHTACLVSLEACEPLWQSPPATAAPLIVLHSWRFEVTTGGTFESLAAGLDLNLFGSRVGQQGLDPGTVISRVGRDGTASLASYRGPLVPTLPVPDAPADNALPDISDAAAYELGRLLATADGRFSREIAGWHRAASLAETRRIFAGPVMAATGHLADASGQIAPADAAPPGRRAAAEAGSPGPATPPRRTAAPDLAALRLSLLERLAASATCAADPYGVPPAARARTDHPPAAQGKGAAGEPPGTEEER